ncbi:MAG: AraC family transcriptional regulator [Deltaproteobacteria bacterium]|nr:AraC family transcriptional regulator [Deltaproteobacteria bacterium]
MISRSEQLHSFPASKASTLIELVKHWDVSSAKLLDGLDLDETKLETPDYRLSIPTFRTLVDRARALTGEPGLGFYIGLYRRLTEYETLDFVATSASTLDEAIQFVVRHLPVVTTVLTFRLEVKGAVAAFIIDENAELGSIRDYIYFSLLTSIWKGFSLLTGKDLNETVHLVFPEPPYYSRFSNLMPETHFEQAVNQILFDASLLELPVAAPDRAALQSAHEQCERDFISLGFRRGIVERVRRALRKPGGFRSSEEVAAALHVSQRTLRRQLAAKSVNFSELLEQERREQALLLLDSSSHTLEEITEYVGYSSVSSFVRAFHRWTGMTPAEYKRLYRI